MADIFWREHCPMLECQATLHVVRVVGEPLTNPSWLGTTVLCCYECNMIFLTEAVMDQEPALFTARLRKEKKRRVNFHRVIATYEDMASMADTFRQYTQMAYQDGSNLSERALHFLSVSYTYLTRLQQQLEGSIKNIRAHLDKQE